MRNLFSRSGVQSLTRFCAEPESLLCAFDFDGTLAPIVARPCDARMSAAVEDHLSELAKVSSVVVISGRSVSDLRTRVSLPGVLLAGSHGLESPFVSASEREMSRATSEAWRATLEAGTLSSLPGVELENKTFSLALHFRHAPDPAQARARLVALAGTLRPLPRLVGGKEVINLVHPALPHKGTALASFQASLARKRSLYVGDDVTDEDVFAQASPALFSIRVGRGGTTHAQTFIPRQRDVRRLLGLLLELLS
jgi:trehalose 6-phosphate phosphatase